MVRLEGLRLLPPRCLCIIAIGLAVGSSLIRGFFCYFAFHSLKQLCLRSCRCLDKLPFAACMDIVVFEENGGTLGPFTRHFFAFPLHAEFAPSCR